MKHILFNIFKGLLLAGAAAACIVFYLYTIDFFAPPPSVGLLTSPSGKTYLDADTLKTALEAEEVELLTAEPGESYADAANRLLAAGAGVLIVPQDAASVDSSLLEAAETAGATVFFVGESPSDATLNSSAELWYLGSLASHGGVHHGEQRGGEVGVADAALEGSGGKASQVRHHAPAQVEEQGLAGGAALAQGGPDGGERVDVLVEVARGDGYGSEGYVLQCFFQEGEAVELGVFVGQDEEPVVVFAADDAGGFVAQAAADADILFFHC